MRFIAVITEKTIAREILAAMGEEPDRRVPDHRRGTTAWTRRDTEGSVYARAAIASP